MREKGRKKEEDGYNLGQNPTQASTLPMLFGLALTPLYPICMDTI
jgi:hypothetical protein